MSNDSFNSDDCRYRRFPRDSVDYEVNMESLHEMENVVPMTLPERTELRKWVKKGNDIDSNPWGYYDNYGCLMCFLQAYRIVFGFSSGPWDCWKGSESYAYWSQEHNCFIYYDDLTPES